MPGFIAHIGNEKLQFAPEKRTKLVVNRMEGKGFQIERRVVNKFMNDRLFSETDKYIVVVEGVIVNNHDLMAKHQSATWLDCVVNMYEQEGDSFFNAFRGSFSGLLYDKSQDKWLVYTNHIGDKQVFVYHTPNGYLFASEIGFIVNICKQNGWSLSLDETGAYFTLTHGFCIEDITLIKEIRKLPAGYYYKLRNGQLSEIQYHRFSNKPKEMSKDEAVDGIDRFFRQAVKREFEKDKEYGYQHIVCLSGGLDSRMTVWVSHQMGYTNQLNITYSQSGYLDFSIAQQIAIDLHHDWLFKPLDGGDCIREIDNVTSIAYGSATFFGLAHGYSMERLINYDDYGIIHTGQIGDSIIGTFFKKNGYNLDYKIGQGAYSLELIDHLKDYKFKHKYENEEIFCLYTRAFTGANQGLLTFQENSESYSPFTDVDFLEFAYSIPVDLRYNHRIYFDWILDKYPHAGEYVWEHTNALIQRVEKRKIRTMKIFGHIIPHFTEPTFTKYLHGFIHRRLQCHKRNNQAKIPSKHNMNPIDYWYHSNPFLREFIDSYWKDNEYLLPHNQLGKDMLHLYKDCAFFNKLQALTVLAALKRLKQ